MFTGAGLLWISFAGPRPAFALPIGWNLRFGQSFVGVTGDLADSLNRSGRGFDWGLSVRWPASAPLSVQADLLVSNRSESFDDMVTSGFGAGTMLVRSLSVQYVQVPLLARASLRRTQVVRPYALAGPYVAWRRSSRITPGHYVGDEPVNPSDVRAVDFGTILGIGANVVTETGRFALEARLGLGGIDVLEDRTGVRGAYRVWTILLGFTP